MLRDHRTDSILKKENIFTSGKRRQNWGTHQTGGELQRLT